MMEISEKIRSIIPGSFHFEYTVKNGKLEFFHQISFFIQSVLKFNYGIKV